MPEMDDARAWKNNLNTNLTKLQCGWMDFVSDGTSALIKSITLKTPYTSTKYVVFLVPISDTFGYYDRTDLWAEITSKSSFKIHVNRNGEPFEINTYIRVGWLAYPITQ